MAHARLSPSSAHRWLRCPGSVALCDKLPEQPRGAAATEGTRLHYIAAEVLDKGGPVPNAGWMFEDEDGTWVLTEEQRDVVMQYVDMVREFSPNGWRFVEQAVQLDTITGEEGAKGTADCIVIDGDELQVHDAKFGRGVEVDAEGNEQLMLYALGAMEAHGRAVEIESVRGFIHQPRISPDPKIAVWKPIELKKFGQHVAQVALRIEQGDAPLVPGEKQCRFCPAKATCPAIKQAVLDAFDDGIPDDELALSDSLAKVGMIEQWCKDLRTAAQRRLTEGKPLRGYKLVEGKRGNRQWNDPKEAASLLEMVAGEEAYTKELLSPAQAEKLLKEKRFDKYESTKKLLMQDTKQSRGVPTVAPVSDKRPNWSGVATPEMFD